MQLTIETPSARSVGLFAAGVIAALALVFGPGLARRLEPRPAPPAPAPAPTPTPPAPTPKPFPSTRRTTVPADFPAHLCGWTPDHPDRRLIARGFPTLAQAGPGLAADRSKSVLLYKVWKEVFADYPDYPAQQIGDCESFGHGHAHDLLQTVEAYLGDLDASAVGRTCTEAFYAAGREAGNMLGWGDGCYGSAMLEAATTMGVLRYADLPDGQQAYSGQRAKQWGRSGLPSELKAIAAGRRLSGAMLASADEMLAALQAGHPCTISTAHGFTMTRDSQGFCRLRGRWGHCMGVVGYRADRPGFLVIQSWGPKTPDGPTDLDQPTWSFWADWSDIETIIAEGDSNTLSATPGFAPRKMPAALSAA